MEISLSILSVSLSYGIEFDAKVKIKVIIKRFNIKVLIYLQKFYNP